jgi:acyl-CoA synthetase (AMP-forming)/AMP-acid ligase II
MNCALEQRIEHFAELLPDKAAVISGGETLTYSSLWERIRERSRQLGLAKGQPHVFLATQDADFIVTYCAVHLCGAVAVPLEHSTPLERQQQIRDELSGKFTPPEGEREAADILYTTGTTGDAKGVMISPAAWAANTENLTDRLGFSQDLLFIVCGPLNHLGCLSKIYPTLTAGGTLYLMENLRDLNAFFAVFRLPFARFATFLVPSSIRMLLQLARKELARVSDRVDFIETGAAAISRHDMETLCQILPQSRLFNTYASTETGIVCSYEFSRYGCEPGVLGKPMLHSRVRIDGGGRVICSGDTIMSGYAGSPEATARVLKGGEIYTSDIGTIDAQGMLHLQGRMDDVINVGGYKVNPSEVEDAVSAFPSVRDCICIPARHVVLGTAPKLLYVPQPGLEVKPQDIARFLRGRIESYKIPLLYEAVESIRRTYNGKPDRKAYLQSPSQSL